jgi:serine/threonine-protein kinase 24/25/MST4
MEFCSEGSLGRLIKKKGFLQEVYIAIIIKEVLSALNYLHTNKKIHRDIKPDNILINKAGEVKITDFGVSSKLTDTLEKTNTLTGTPYYIAPEVIAKELYDYKADIWSVGITVIEMATGQPPNR